MTRFAVGQRVVVKPDNEYDVPEPSHHGVMAGHFGKVTDVTTFENVDGEQLLISVQLTGRVDGAPSAAAIGGPASLGAPINSTSWFFFPRELEHAD